MESGTATTTSCTTIPNLTSKCLELSTAGSQRLTSPYRFQYFRQDLDIAFGSLDNRFQGSTRNIYTWYEDGRGYRLTEKIMGVPEYRQAFTDYFYMYMDAYYKTSGPLVTRGNRLSSQVTAGILKVCSSQLGVAGQDLPCCRILGESWI